MPTERKKPQPSSVDDFLDGAKKAGENAAELIGDAELLLAHGRAPRAYALAHLASEEIAKALILASVASHVRLGASPDLTELKRRLFDHQEKFVMQSALEMLRIRPAMDKATVERIGEAFEDDVKHVRAHERMKQRSLYVDVQGRRFTTPRASISVERARALVSMAVGRLELAREFIDYVEAEGEKPIEELRRSHAATERKLLQAIIEQQGDET
jgi:AbiV family abortive infection protein